MDNSVSPQLFGLFPHFHCNYPPRALNVSSMTPLGKLREFSPEQHQHGSRKRPPHLHNQKRADAWQRVSDIASILSKLDAELADLCDELAQSKSKHLDHRASIAQALEYLSQAASARRSSETSLAWCAERTEIGRLVGTTTTRGYYTKRLGYSTSHANTVKNRATTAYGQIHIAEYDPDDEEVEVESSNQRSKRMRLAKNKLNQERYAQSTGRELARKISTDKVDVIDRELRHLNDTAVPGKHQVRLESMKEADKGRNCADLTHWCRERIRNANNHPDAYSSPAKARATQESARSKRYISQPRELPNGMINFGITTDPVFSTRIEAIRAKATRVWKARQADATVTETRTLSQFVHDYFMNAIFGPTPNSEASQVAAESAEKTTTARVSAQLVLVGTIDDYLNMGPRTRFRTDTGTTLTPAEIMQLGISECHLGITDNGRAKLLDAGSVRNTTQIQRAFLTAMQLVCSHPGCSEPAAKCEGHHITAYSHGGKTNIENLTLLCAYHHRGNNDQRDGQNNMGHMERENDTHLVGKFNPSTGKIDINETITAHNAPGRRLLAASPTPTKARTKNRAA